MEEVTLKVSKVDSSSNLKKIRKSRSKARTVKKPKVAPKLETSMFKSAWGYFSGLYGNSSKQEGAKLSTADELNGELEVNRNPNRKTDTNKKRTTQRTFPSEYAMTRDNQGDSRNNEICEGGIDCSPGPSYVPILHRPSGLLPRQTSSGINAILLDTLRHSENQSNDPEIHTSTTYHNRSDRIRSTYDRPKTPLPALTLSNIFQNRIKEGTWKGRRPGILNRAFFDSVSAQIKKIKSKPNTAAEIHEDPEIFHEEERYIPKPVPAVRRNSKTSGPSSSTIKNDSNANFNINFTVQLAQVEGQSTTADVGDISINGQNRTVTLSPRNSVEKVETCMQTETEAEMWGLFQAPNDSGECLVSDETAIAQINLALDALEYTGDSIMTALSLVTNMVPQDDTEMNEEEMNANEDDIAITLMRMMGVPQELRHKIYLEACDEIEVLQDVTAGTIDALGTVLKWIVGGSRGRKDLMCKTRALCAVHSEVDTDSEIWHRLQENVAEITENVESAVSESVEIAQNTSMRCGKTIVEYVTTVPSSVSVSRHELVTGPDNGHMECINEEDDIKNHNCTEEMDTGLDEHQTYAAKSTKESPMAPQAPQQFSNRRQYFFKDPETSFLYSPNAFREELQNPTSTFGPSETSLQLAKSGRFEDYDETFAEMMKERNSNQRALCGNLNKDGLMFQKQVFQDKKNNNIVPQGQIVARYDMVEDFAGVIRRLSKSFLPHFLTPSDQKEEDDNSNCATKTPSQTSSVESSQSLERFSRAPPNSLTIFEKIKDDQKVLEDIARLQQLVQELYENTTPGMVSKTDMKDTDFKFLESSPVPSTKDLDENSTQQSSKSDMNDANYEYEFEDTSPVLSTKNLDSQSDMDHVNSEYEAKQSITTVSRTKASNSTISTSIEMKRAKIFSKIPTPVKALSRQASECRSNSRTPVKNSTVSLYHSNRSSSIGRKSVYAMDNQIHYSPSALTAYGQPDENNNNLRQLDSYESLKSTASMASRPPYSRCSKVNASKGTSIPKRDFIRENKSSVTSTATTMGSTRPSSRASTAISSYSISSSSTTQNIGAGYPERAEVKNPVDRRQQTAKKPPIIPRQFSTSSVSTNSSNSYGGKSRPPKSYKQILNQRKGLGYKVIAQEYIKSISSSNGNKNSSTSASSSAYSSKR